MRVDTGECLRTVRCLPNPSGSDARWMRVDTGECLRTVLCLPNPSGSAESERLRREVDEGGHRRVPAHCPVPPESERLRREVDEGAIGRTWFFWERAMPANAVAQGSISTGTVAFAGMARSYNLLRSHRPRTKGRSL